MNINNPPSELELTCLPKKFQDVETPMKMQKASATKISEKSPIRILIFAIDFSDKFGERPNQAHLLSLENKVSVYFKKVSRDKIKLTWKSSEKYFRMAKTLESYFSNSLGNSEPSALILRDAQNLAKTFLELSDYDYFVALPPSSVNSKEIPQTISLIGEQPDYLNSTILANDFWENGQPWSFLAHEMGHAFGLMDLYSNGAGQEVMQIANASSKRESPFQYMGYLDLMNWADGPAPGLTLWNRWLLGLLDKGEIKCVNRRESFVMINSIQSLKSNIKGVFIPLDSTRFIVLEFCSGEAEDSKLPKCARGLTAYLVDVSLSSGEGSLRILPNKNGKLSDSFCSSIPRGGEISYKHIKILNYWASPKKAIVKISNSIIES